jgi:hypothetical protein
MTEEFLHYIWRTKQVLPQLHSTKNEIIQILDFGFHNQDAGPDFLLAKALIDGQIWAGQIEMHVSSSDWIKHNHSDDAAYHNVILHVVYNHDKEIIRSDNTEITTLELKGKIDEHLYWRYEQLVQGERFISCENQIQNVDEFTRMHQYDKWLLERLERKSKWISASYSVSKDWNEILYKAMVYSFGLKVNADSFLAIAEKLPLKILEKHKGDLFQLEALLFGVSGLLQNDFKDEYPTKLKAEFEFFRTKYDLVTLSTKELKFSRMRPQGFPTLRLAQLAALFNFSFPDFDVLMAQGDLNEFYNLLKIEPSAYWRAHYNFDTPSNESTKKPTKEFLNKIIINAISPLLFSYSEVKNESFYKQRAMDILDQLPAEKNKITTRLQTLGFSNSNGFESQAVLEMYSNYCQVKNCLNCGIANKLLRLEL